LLEMRSPGRRNIIPEAEKMSKFFIPTRRAEDWKDLLAEPSKHWRSGRSARALAYCWEEAQGLPPSVRDVFSRSGIPCLKDMELLIAIPEHQVLLPGGSRPSQSDIFVLARAEGQLTSMTVEGKVSETFGPTVDEWLVDASAGKMERLAYLCERLGLEQESTGSIRYQLLHRTVSALIEAERFSARNALMLVHSFSQEHVRLGDYQALLSCFSKKGTHNSVTYVGERKGINLYLSWVVGEKKFLNA